MMKVLMRSESEPGTQRYVFFCPGCECYHFFYTPGWTLKGTEGVPTVEPSILTTTKPEGVERKCHLYIKAGQIEFLGDCWHDKKGTTVPMVEV